MVFSSPIFIFAFLPLALVVYFSSPKQLKNGVLLAISLAFYAWGEMFYVAVMLVSIIVNYIIGHALQRAREHSDTYKPATVKSVLAVGIAINLLLLGSFKYANFLADNLNLGLGLLTLPPLLLEPVHLPLGISFFTFQAMSYLIDIYRGEARAQRNLLDLALYIALFPQLIAGPIVRYHDIADQLANRQHSLELFVSGVQRFIYGLAKKLLIANSMAAAADAVFALPQEQLSTSLVWFGIICYSLQIYFDFSGYSDMAIGLGRMFGFRFLENFNYPYISRSIQEFWRRWHISLSSWFRDYLYIPLGGNRVAPWRVYLNLISVFFLCGLWHGAAWNFVVWGLLHGLFLVLERLGLGRFMARQWRAISHLYTLSVVLLAWVFFRADNLQSALDYVGLMLIYEPPTSVTYPLQLLLSFEFLAAFFIGVLFATPLYGRLTSLLKTALSQDSLVYQSQRLILITVLMLACAIKLSASTYNPFIYFRF